MQVLSRKYLKFIKKQAYLIYKDILVFSFITRFVFFFSH